MLRSSIQLTGAFALALCLMGASGPHGGDDSHAAAPAPVERIAPPAPVERAAPAAPIEHTAPDAPIEHTAPVAPIASEDRGPGPIVRRDVPTTAPPAQATQPQRPHDDHHAGAATSVNSDDTLDNVAAALRTVGIAAHLFLKNYRLDETACIAGAPLVVIRQPDGTVTCASPNAVVHAGTYTVDPNTSTLVPLSGPRASIVRG